MGLTVAVLANLRSNAPAHVDAAPDAWAELETEGTMDAIVEAIRSAGHQAVFLEGDRSLVDRLPRLAPDICFNLCEGHQGDSRESQVPAILEMLGIPYTGPGVLALALTLDKPLTKRLLVLHGIPSPPFQVFHRADAPLAPHLSYPLFVKPSREGSSLGVTDMSIVESEADLRLEVARQLARFRQPILVERFVRGREVTVGILGNVAPDHAADPTVSPDAPVPPGLRVLAPLEVHLDRYTQGGTGVYVDRIKSDPGDEYHYSCPAPLSAAATRRLQSLAAAVFAVTGCRDVARVDFRLDADDEQPYVLEINGLPGLSPGYSDLVLAAHALGIGYRELILSILDHATARYGLPGQVGP